METFMTAGPDSTSGAHRPARGKTQARTEASLPLPSTGSIDRVIRWSVICFAISSVVLALIAWHAVRTNQVAAYLNVAGVVYVIMSTVFLGVLALAFVRGHLGSSRDIEAPKMELFEIEQRK
jgi:hypothetical protein